MMKFNYSLLAAAFLTGTVVLSSCSSDELPVGNEVQQLATEPAMTFSFSAPAVMGDEADTRVFDIGESSIESTFSTEENVYVYIQRGDVIAFGCTFDMQQGIMRITPLHPDRDGKTCKIVADNLQYYTKDANSGYSYFTPQVGDYVHFQYGMTVDPSDPLGGYYDFTSDGSLADVSKKDFCQALMVVYGVDNGVLTLGSLKSPAHNVINFYYEGSIFRQKITFIDGYTTVNPVINKFVISKSDDDFRMVQYYSPFGKNFFPEFAGSRIENFKYKNHFELNNPEFTEGNYNIYFTSYFNSYNYQDALQISAYDVNNNKYVASKIPPTDGFQNDKYYYGTANLVKSRIVAPVITGDCEYDLLSDFDFGLETYRIISKNSDFTISGSSKYWLIGTAYENNKVTLNNMNVETDASPFYRNLYGSYAQLTLNLVGENVIVMDKQTDHVFSGNTGNIKLQCTGDSATLTIEFDRFEHGCFYNFNNLYGIDFLTEDAIDATTLKNLAADGYMVERSALGFNEAKNRRAYTFTVRKI